MTENIDRIFFADEKIHQEFRDVYAGLYQNKERYVDIVKALGSQFYGMTQKEIVAAIKVKSGGTLSKHLKNLLESGVVRQYPRYGKERVEQDAPSFAVDPGGAGDNDGSGTRRACRCSSRRPAN